MVFAYAAWVWNDFKIKKMKRFLVFLSHIAQKMDPTSSPMHLCLTQCSVVSITCLLQMRNGQARYELYLTYIESCLGHRTDRNGLDTRMESNLLTFSNRKFRARVLGTRMYS